MNEEQGEEEAFQWESLPTPPKKRKLKLLYQEWHIGKITWYNKVLDGHREEYNDGTDDYINLNDVDGIEAILLD